MERSRVDSLSQAAPTPESATSGGETTSPRSERLAAIRAMIDGGTYETTERLEAALSRFLAATGGHS